MNAVVYSIHAHSPIESNAHWQLFVNSVVSLREYNSTIPVICYLNSVDHLVPAVNEFFANHNVTLMVYDENCFFGVQQQPLTGTDNAWQWAFIIHKWPNVIDAMEKLHLSRALFVDTDTYWRGDVQRIFDDYPPDRIWYRSEYTGYIPRVLEAEMAMNDGVFLLSQEHATRIQPYYFTRYNTLMTQYLMENKPLLTADQYEQIAWSGWQYITHIILRELALPTGEFDPNQVAFSNEPTGFQEKDANSPLILHHYYKTNIYLYQPHLMHLQQR
jgi:hypothetical protein